MSNIQIEIIDCDNQNQITEISSLTKVGLEMLISDCKTLLEKLEEAYFIGDEDD